MLPTSKQRVDPSAAMSTSSTNAARVSPSIAIIAAGCASVIAFSAAIAVAAIDISAGLSAMLAAGIVASLLAALMGFYAAAQRSPTIETRSAGDRAATPSDSQFRLAAAETRYRDMLDRQDELIELRAADGSLLFANKAYRHAFPVADHRAATQYWPGVLATEREGENELVSTLQGPRWIAWSEHDIENRVRGAERLRVGRDVTDDRRKIDEYAKGRDYAQNASEAKSRFLASMSHEIRTPMNGILGMSSLLGETKLSDQQRCYARAIDESARALLTLLDEILDFSKIEAGRLELAHEQFSIRGCIARAIGLLRPRADIKELALTTYVDQSVPEMVVGDEARLRQILLNLLSNAVKFTDAGSVRLNAYAQAANSDAGDVHIAIEVIDTGIGFTANELIRLFDEFDQGDGAVRERRGGVGLGLAISRRLALAMGGDVTAERAAGGGAEFRVRVRLAVATADRKTPVHGGVDAAHEREGNLNNLRILIAEDNAINALLARTVVERLGAIAEVVVDGAAAVDAVRNVVEGRAPPIDLIMMDMVMPVMDGLQASRAVRELYASSADFGGAPPPIIALTANAYPEDRARCIAAGLDDYLAKPFDAGQLQTILKKWVAIKAVSDLSD